MDFKAVWESLKQRNAQTLRILCHTKEDAKIISLAIGYIESEVNPPLQIDVCSLDELDDGTYVRGFGNPLPIEHYGGNTDNKILVYVRTKDYAFDILSFVERYKDRISEVHMTGVNAFKPIPEYKISVD